MIMIKTYQCLDLVSFIFMKDNLIVFIGGKIANSNYANHCFPMTFNPKNYEV